MDRVLERIENQYWKIEVSDFKSWMLGFISLKEKWKTTPLSEAEILVEYTYTLFANQVLLYPFNWLFAHLFLAHVHERVLENVHKMIGKQ
ncbi:MAG: hypothetical protein IPO72_00425 [Saprospiraceae bacterium]|nr:hypothetical protein [Candidatus Vicinibacter affinis]